MGLREDLEAFCKEQAGIDHLVYGDLGTRMVLHAWSVEKLGQEAHDAMVARAGEVFLGPLAGFDGTGDREPLQVLLREAKGCTIFVKAGGGVEEGLFFRLARVSDPVAAAQAATDLLSQITADEG